MSSEILASRPQVKHTSVHIRFLIFLFKLYFRDVFVFQLPFSIMSRELEESFDFDEDEVEMEYCVYDVTPDVSIDFVSFTTEESEGIKEVLCKPSVLISSLRFQKI